MSLRSDSQYNFQDFDEEKMKHASTSRQQYIGPWVESNSSRVIKTRRELYKNNTITQNKVTNLQILATIHKQSEWKRKQYKTIMNKISQIQKNNLLSENLQRRKKALQYLTQNETSNLDNFKKYKIQAEQEKEQETQIYSPLHQNANKGKKALNTTMYVYECKDQRKKSKTYRNYSQFHNSPNKKSEQQQQKQMGQGSNNLQRILKMKERLRVKNSSIVRQIRQKQIQSDKYIAFKHIEELKPMKNWKSTTLDFERMHHQNQMIDLSPRKFKAKQNIPELNPNQIILESEFNLFGTVSNNFFSKY